jgi:F420-0:gamma-glutamyl ligase
MLVSAIEIHSDLSDEFGRDVGAVISNALGTRDKCADSHFALGAQGFEAVRIPEHKKVTCSTPWSDGVQIVCTRSEAIPQ